jgi:hypothetical protein
VTLNSATLSAGGPASQTRIATANPVNECLQLPSAIETPEPRGVQVADGAHHPPRADA